MKNNLKIPIAEKDKEGFELFDKEDVYFFYYKDEYENILLQSKPFENEDDRAYAIEEVLQIFTNEKNIQIKNNSNLFYFVVKDSKDLPIARSTIFDTQNQVEKALVVFKQKMVAIAFPQSEPIKEIERFSAKSIIPIYETNIPNRFSFRVDVYRSEDDQTIFGKIEYSLTQERINFNGLDGEKITHFMRSKICIPTSTLSLDTYLDSNGTDTRIESHDKRSPINTLPKPATTNKIAFSHQVQKSNLEISLLKDNFILSNQCLVQNEQYHLEIAIENMREESCLLNIFVKSLSSNYRNTINEIQCKTDSHGKLIVPFYTEGLTEGLFQMVVTIRPTVKSDNNLYTGNTYFNIM